MVWSPSSRRYRFTVHHTASYCPLSDVLQALEARGLDAAWQFSRTKQATAFRLTVSLMNAADRDLAAIAADLGTIDNVKDVRCERLGEDKPAHGSSSLRERTTT